MRRRAAEASPTAHHAPPICIKVSIMTAMTRPRFSRRLPNSVLLVGVLWTASSLQATADVASRDELPQDARVVYLSDAAGTVSIQHHQQWGEFGRDTAAAAPGRAGAAMRIGDRTFEKGLGHHATGEIAMALEDEFTEFHTWVGVQWQGGNRGSVVFRVLVDDRVAFESPPMSDSDPAREVRVPVAGARQLRLIASDSGDGIGCDMANWADARLIRPPGVPWFGPPTTRWEDGSEPTISSDASGLTIIGHGVGPQVALMRPARRMTVGVQEGETLHVSVPVGEFGQASHLLVDVGHVQGKSAEAQLAVHGQRDQRRLAPGESTTLRVELVPQQDPVTIQLTTHGTDGEAGVRWQRLRYVRDSRTIDVPLRFPRVAEHLPPPVLPSPRPAIEQALIEWDWRLQDGIGMQREPRTWSQAIELVLQRGDQLIQDLTGMQVPLHDLVDQWEGLRGEFVAVGAGPDHTDDQWESLWRRVHAVRRAIVLRNPLADTGPLVFAKQVPSCFSHQLTQYYGMCARPGGGLFVLESPGASMRCRELVSLPPGSFQHPEVSWDGERLMFAYCEVPSVPLDRTVHQDRHYQIYEVRADGSGLRQMTEGPYDHFSPRFLPDGNLLFISTRRGGFHRCGAGPCPVYTLTLADADGSNVRPISFHETHEWDPAVLNDGRILYTRWDYVDRHAVYYQQLWTARPDGTGVAAYYGNNTLNPVGVWEARPVPNSSRVMATAGAHHAMTAGSVILLDVAQGIDGLEPIERLTPDVLFPESESPVQHWHAPAGVHAPLERSVEERRWPGHCYRSPFPLSESYFLAAYSYDPLIGEPLANHANMFGVYLVDRFGNKELLYRDANIACVWPTPLRPRSVPPALPAASDVAAQDEGTFFLQNVYDAWPPLPSGPESPITHLRIVQVLVKTTPHANQPRVGLANASPGKQVLGTVPVEPDGSAYFRAPARVPLAFQALDEHGMAVQTMRSLTYLQPGEQASCIGCHEHRSAAPDARPSGLARLRDPSPLEPGPDGSRPLSYPLLVQPVLDRHCVSCHGGAEPAGGIVLTGEPSGEFSVSYHALAPRVAFSQWSGTPAENSEPLTYPDRFGARASTLMQLLREGHEGVQLSAEELTRLATWMDANALFYGTFDPQDQQRQLQGDRIAGPAME